MFCCGVFLALTAHTESMVLNSLILERFGMVSYRRLLLRVHVHCVCFQSLSLLFCWNTEKKDFAMCGTKMNRCLL